METAGNEPLDLNILIEKIKSGEIYGELQSQMAENLRKRRGNSRKNANLDELQERLLKKEEEVTRLLGEIIRLKNEISNAIQKELES